MNLNIVTRSTLLLVSSTLFSQGAVVEFWDFEEGVDGQSFTPAGQPNGSGASPGVNGTLIHGWNVAGGPSYTATTSPSGGTLGMSGIYQDGYVFNEPASAPLMGWSSPNWTVEMHIRINDADGWETFMAKMGSSFGVSESDFYLQRKGIDSNELRLNYVPASAADNTGRIVVDGITQLVADQWYGIAAVADSTAGTIALYLDSGSGYSLEALATGLTGDLGVQQNTLDWAFNRDFFNNGVNNTSATYDNIRISDTALTMSQLTALAPVPEPGIAILGSLGMLGLLRRRR